MDGPQRLSKAGTETIKERRPAGTEAERLNETKTKKKKNQKKTTVMRVTKHIKKQRYHFADKGLYSQSYGSSSSHLWT